LTETDLRNQRRTQLEKQTLERSEPDLDAPAQTLRRGIVYTPQVFGKGIVTGLTTGSVTIDVLPDNA
jgi:hypothetical protein